MVTPRRFGARTTTTTPDATRTHVSSLSIARLAKVGEFAMGHRFARGGRAVRAVVAAAAEQHVLRLDVRVHEPARVQVRERGRRAGDELRGERLGERGRSIETRVVLFRGRGTDRNRIETEGRNTQPQLWGGEARRACGKDRAFGRRRRGTATPPPLSRGTRRARCARGEPLAAHAKGEGGEGGGRGRSSSRLD